MDTVFAYGSFTSANKVYFRNEPSIASPIADKPALIYCTTIIYGSTFHCRNILHRNNHSSLNGSETPPGPYDDDDDDDDGGSN